MSGSGLAVGLSVLAGLAGAIQVALMSQLGDRISIVGALAFATLFTAVASFVILILFEPVRSWLENSINRWLLRQRSELRGRLESVRRELPGVVDVNDMSSRIMSLRWRRLTIAS